MATIREEIDKLDDGELSYVIERSKVLTDAAAYRAAGISRTTYYRWDNDVRDRLNSLAQRLKREAALKARMVMEEAVEDAARLLVAQIEGGKGKKVPASVQQRAAVEVLDRVAGKPTQHVQAEVSGKGGGPIVLRWPEDVEDDD